MSTVLRALYDYVAGAPQPVSAVDVRICSHLTVSDPRKRLKQLRDRGCIEVAYTSGRETFYRVVEGASPPRDLREGNGLDGDTMRRVRASRWPRSARRFLPCPR